MANRNMQQKTLKMQRMRRAYLKKFSTKGTGPIKYPGFFNEQHEFVDTSLRSRTKAASNFIDEHLLKKYRFKPNSPEALYVRRAGLHSDMNDGQILLARQIQSAKGSGSLQGEEKFCFQRIPDKRFVELRLYMGRSTNFFIGYEIKGDKRLMFTSIEYHDRKRALFLQARNEIVWLECEELELLPS